MANSRTIVRVVVANDRGTDKSSLITAAASESFPEYIQFVLLPIRLPPDFYLDSVPVVIIDTSSSVESRGKLAEELAVVLTYAYDQPATLNHLSTFWLHELRRLEEVEEVVVAQMFGTQESVTNFNSYPSYMGPVMFPNMMPHNMRPNMGQGGSILPLSPTFWPTETGFNQFMNNFPRSYESNMPSLLNNQLWRGQSTITGAQVSEGGQSSSMKNQGQGWGGGHQSFTQMMNARDNDDA